MKIKYFFSNIFLTGIMFVSCNHNNKNEDLLIKELNEYESVEIPNEINKTDSILVNKNTVPTYGIIGEEIFIRKGPGYKFDKIINEKATSVSTVTQYIQVDYTVKVEIMESKGNWSKIKVVDPSWLIDSHIGWIPTKYIIKDQVDIETKMVNLDSKDYEIIKTNHSSSTQNFHVLIKQKGFDKESVFLFVKKFRQEHCSNNCNVYVYDSKSILPLIDKYPLKGKEYITLADHFISMSTFDAINLKSWYPYQDFQYRDYGGQNWKDKPIE